MQQSALYSKHFPAPHMMNERLMHYSDLLVAMAMQYVPKVFLALITLVVGFWLVRFLIKAMHRALQMERVDKSLAGFLENLISIVLKILVIMTVAMMIGVEMTSFIALLGAVGLAVGLSLQGSLANLAGGILILFFKPFKVGEEITAMTQKGVVEKIEMFATVLRGADGTMIIIPNGPLSNGVVLNHSRHGKIAAPKPVA